MLSWRASRSRAPASLSAVTALVPLAQAPWSDNVSTRRSRLTRALFRRHNSLPSSPILPETDRSPRGDSRRDGRPDGMSAAAQRRDTTPLQAVGAMRDNGWEYVKRNRHFTLPRTIFNAKKTRTTRRHLVSRKRHNATSERAGDPFLHAHPRSFHIRPPHPFSQRSDEVSQCH